MSEQIGESMTDPLPTTTETNGPAARLAVALHGYRNHVNGYTHDISEVPAATVVEARDLLGVIARAGYRLAEAGGIDGGCPGCDGEGSDADALDEDRRVTCPDCAGSGKAAHSITVNEMTASRMSPADLAAFVETITDEVLSGHHDECRALASNLSHDDLLAALMFAAARRAEGYRPGTSESATRVRALREAAGWVAMFDQGQDTWPDEHKIDRSTVRRLTEGLRAVADSAEARTQAETSADRVWVVTPLGRGLHGVRGVYVTREAAVAANPGGWQPSDADMEGTWGRADDVDPLFMCPMVVRGG